MKKLIKLLSVVGLVLLCTGMVFAAEKEIRIGVVGPMTGPGVQYGASMKESAQLAVDEINAAGGVNGRKIVVFFEDDESNPAKAVSSMQKLINKDQIAVAIGHYNSSCTLATMQVTQRAKTPHLCPISTAAAVTESGNKYIFRNCATNPMQVGQLANWAFTNLTKDGGTKAAVIYENTDYGTGLTEIFVDLAKKNPKWEVLVQESYNPSDTDMIAQLTKIKSLNPDVLMIGGNLTEAAVIIRQAKEIGLNVQIMGLGGGFSNDRFAELAGVENVEGIVNVSYFEKSSTNPLAQEFVKNYIAKYNKDPDMFGAATYEAVDIVAKVAEKLSDEDFANTAKLREAMWKGIAGLKALPGVQGPTTFDETGQADKMVYIVRWENGKRVIVFP